MELCTTIQTQSAISNHHRPFLTTTTSPALVCTKSALSLKKTTVSRSGYGLRSRTIQNPRSTLSFSVSSFLFTADDFTNVGFLKPLQCGWFRFLHNWMLYIGLIYLCFVNILLLVIRFFVLIWTLKRTFE